MLIKKDLVNSYIYRQAYLWVCLYNMRRKKGLKRPKIVENKNHLKLILK